MISEKQLQIFGVFVRKPFIQYTRNEIKILSKENSNNFMALTINSLKEEGVLLEQKVGRSGLLSLNLENDLTYYYIALFNNSKLGTQVRLCLNLLNKEISKETPFYTMVIFGSYAIGEEKEGSDLDVAIIIEDVSLQKKILAQVNSVKLRSVLELDVYVLTRPEMKEMLINSEENLGKQIARKHLVVYSHRLFYELVKEGMKYGFRI